jgi:pyruvate formate lyase activating enzyme
VPTNLESPPAETPLIGSPYDLRVSMGERVGEAGIKEALERGDPGFVHSFTTGSAVDGPGVRVVAWLAGCQFRCLYCHNPDTWKMINGMPVTVARAVEVIKQYRQSLVATKGGLTISGGEPLMQHRFVLNVFREAKKVGIHTALDSNGALGERLTDADLNLIDLVLLDIKAITPDLHEGLTGQPNKPVMEFARRLASKSRPIWVRFVMVPGWTDGLEEIGRVADFAAGLGNVERVDVLPFHQLGKFKWEKLGIDYALGKAEPPSKERVAEAVARFKAAGLNAV